MTGVSFLALAIASLMMTVDDGKKVYLVIFCPIKLPLFLSLLLGAFCYFFSRSPRLLPFTAPATLAICLKVMFENVLLLSSAVFALLTPETEREVCQYTYNRKFVQCTLTMNKLDVVLFILITIACAVCLVSTMLLFVPAYHFCTFYRSSANSESVDNRLSKQACFPNDFTVSKALRNVKLFLASQIVLQVLDGLFSAFTMFMRMRDSTSTIIHLNFVQTFCTVNFFIASPVLQLCLLATCQQRQPLTIWAAMAVGVADMITAVDKAMSNSMTYYHATFALDVPNIFVFQTGLIACGCLMLLSNNANASAKPALSSDCV